MAPSMYFFVVGILIPLSSCEVSLVQSNIQQVITPLKNIGEICNNTSDCIANSECSPGNPVVGNYCRCKESYAPTHGNNECLKIAQHIGDICTNGTIQCIPLSNVSICSNDNKCDCKPGFKPGVNKTSCLSVSSSLNTTCEENIQCDLTNSECLQVKEGKKECKCNTNHTESFVSNNGTCIPIVREVNQACVENQQCQAAIDHSLCDSKICKCAPGYLFHAGHCYFPATLGGVCHTIEECIVGISRYSQCSLILNTSDVTRCRCWNGAIEYDRSCYEPKVVGAACVNNLECMVAIQGQVSCDGKICHCQPGFKSELAGTMCTAGAGRVTQIAGLFLLILLIRLSLD